ncbi:MAG: hypothetical protein OXT67_07885, partial [Zetaproteobacteria bacterium]|nr:hypothetical protein [Zetaproteobacteria bacterium]
QFRMVKESQLRANAIILWYYDDFDRYAQTAKKLKGAGEYLSLFMDNSRHSKYIKDHLTQHFDDRSNIILRLSHTFTFDYNWTLNDQLNQK